MKAHFPYVQRQINESYEELRIVIRNRIFGFSKLEIY